MHRYAIGGETHFAVATEPVIPSDLKPLVATMFGLNDFYPKSMLKPAYTTSGSGHSLAPGDLATIYDINPLYQQGVNGNRAEDRDCGAGRRWIRFRHPTVPQQLWAGSGDTSSWSQDGTPGVDHQGDQMEADLDLEWAGAIAPNATLIYVYGADADSAAFYAIDQNLAPIVSESFGLCEAHTSLGAVPI